MKVSRRHGLVDCAVCGRTLLFGESATRFRAADGAKTVCALCEPQAQARGWAREGGVAPPPDLTLRRRRTLIDRLRERVGTIVPPREPSSPLPPAAPLLPAEPPVVVIDRPVTQRERARQREEQASEAAELASDLAIELYNQSGFRRTMVGIARSLGRPRVSVIALGGIRPDVVLTIAWDLSWYQYRVDPTAEPFVRLERRGDDLSELEPRWLDWNADTLEDGEVVALDP